MEQTSFEVRTDFSALPKKIDFNFEEMKNYLSENLEKYKTLVVTEDAISAAKADRAKLRKLAETINQRKISIKREYTAPYTEFEGKVKELLSMIDGAVENIDSQVKEFETLAKKEKREALEKFFSDNAEETAEILKFENIFNEKWLNVTYSLDVAHAEILTAIKKTRTDTETIRSMGGKYTAALLEEYAQFRDMSDVMRKKLLLEMRDKVEEERLKKAEEERREEAEKTEKKLEDEQRRNDIRAKAETAAKILFPEQKFDLEDVSEADGKSEPATEIIDFRVWVTPEQKIKLRSFIIQNEIKYGRVPKN